MKWLRENWVAKLLALIAAVIMWFFVMKEQNPVVEVTYTVPVKIQNLNQQYILEGAPQEAKVTLRGPRNTLLALNQHTMHAVLDVIDLGEGEHDVDITFNPPTSTVVESITPETAKITIDEYMVKEFSVEIKGNGKLPSDFALQGAELVPKVVTVSGPKSLVNSVAHVYLPVDLNDKTKDFTTNEALEAVNSLGENLELTITPHQGAAKLKLMRTRFNKTILIKPNVIGEPAEGYEIKQVVAQPAQIVIYGSQDTINSINSIDTSVIDVSNINKSLDGTYDVVMPAGLNTPTNKINVHIEVGRKPSVQNLGEGNDKNY